jgi:hypothetical protein
MCGGVVYSLPEKLAMSRSYIAFALTLIVVVLSSSATWGQSQSPSGDQSGEAADSSVGGRNSGLGFSLLRIPKVQDDLGLRQSQKVQILVLHMETQKNRSDMKEKLAEILDSRQMKRLKEIRLQVEGTSAINSHEVAMALGLSREQRKELKDIQNQINQQIMAVFQELQGLTADERQAKKPELVQRLENIRQETTTKALNLLTQDQRDQFDRMQGKKLNLTTSGNEP